MAARTLTAEERRRLDSSMPAGRAGDGLGTTLGDAQDRIVVLEAGVAATAVQGSAEVTDLRMARVQLRGTAKTPVAFGVDSAAALTTTVAAVEGVLDLSSVGDGGTILLNPDAAGEATATLNAAAGTSVSGASPSTDISAGADNKFMISVNGDEAEEVELTLVNCDSGAAIAAEMETQIQELGGDFAAVTVTYDDVVAGKYAIVSAQLGTGSSVVITPALLSNVTEELKIGEDAGGVETAGTGDCDDITAVTLDELVTLINGDIAGVTATNDGTYITITSDTEGRGSSLVAGNSSLKDLIGLAQGAAAYGAQGLGFATDMADADYLVQATVDGTAGGSLGGMCVGVNTRTATGFELECETAASEAYVALLITGVAAAAA